MPRSPRISVVIPAYNAERTLARTLDSVLAQTLRPIEVIVVDDGSSDRTCQVAESYAPEVTLLRQKNGGPGVARNHGIRMACGEWIALVDADDTWLPGKLERQARELGDGVALVHTYVVDSPDEFDFELNFSTLWEHNHIGTSTVVMNRALCLAVGGFPNDRRVMGVEDYNLWLRLAATGRKIVTVREPLAYYTPAEGNLSGQVARVIRAELANLEDIAARFHLPDELVDKKRAALHLEYAKALFWIRDLPLARKYYLEVLKHHVTFSACLHWLATYLPQWVLNARRRTQPTASAPAAAPATELAYSK